MTVQQTLAELVAIDSVSAGANAAIISYLEGRCRALDLLVTKYPYTDDRGVEKINLVAQTSAAAAVELALVGHTDTVPFDQAWTEALRLTEKEEVCLVEAHAIPKLSLPPR